nr:hypothetical protein [Homoserinibacter gongjuensis]
MSASRTKLRHPRRKSLAAQLAPLALERRRGAAERQLTFVIAFGTGALHGTQQLPLRRSRSRSTSEVTTPRQYVAICSSRSGMGATPSCVTSDSKPCGTSSPTRCSHSGDSRASSCPRIASRTIASVWLVKRDSTALATSAGPTAWGNCRIAMSASRSMRVTGSVGSSVRLACRGRS